MSKPCIVLPHKNLSSSEVLK